MFSLFKRKLPKWVASSTAFYVTPETREVIQVEIIKQFDKDTVIIRPFSPECINLSYLTRYDIGYSFFWNLYDAKRKLVEYGVDFNRRRS